MSILDRLSDYLFLGYEGMDITVKTILFSLFMSGLIGFFIFLIYRGVTRKTFYSLNFNISLIAMSMITCAIMLAIQSNIVLSLGMVGALSIVRFRTAVKDPMDLVFLYWSISMGIICGTGLSLIGIVLSLAIAVVIFVLQRYPRKKLSMILVVNSTCLENDGAILETVKRHAKWYKLKSKNLTDHSLDMVLELAIEEESPLVHELIALKGVTSASILSHDGEITA
ncbi:MAG: DUF4956 domain-containing protein [Faecousia sp.]